MVLSSHLAPGFIRTTYSGTRNPHHQVIPIKFDGVPTAGSSPAIVTTDGGTVDWSTALISYVNLAFAPQFPTTVKIGIADIYSVNPTTGVRTFIYTANINLPGTAVVAQVPFSEAVWVYKSSVGKPVKVWLMESVYAANVRNIGVVPADGREAMNDYILSGDNIFYGRTDAWPLAFQTFTSKINDVLRRNGGFTDV